MAHNPTSCPHVLPMINNIFHRSSNLTRVPSSISDKLSSLHEYTKPIDSLGIHILRCDLAMNVWRHMMQ